MNHELVMPQDLTPVGRMAWAIIYELLKKYELTFTGGCTVFRSPKYWEERKEEFYGTGNAELIVVYDGAEAKRLCADGAGDAKWKKELQLRLNDVGLYYEEGTHWYGAVLRCDNYDSEKLRIRGLIKHAPQDTLAYILTQIADAMFEDDSSVEKKGKPRGTLYNAGREVDGGDLVSLVAQQFELAGLEPEFSHDFDDEPE